MGEKLLVTMLVPFLLVPNLRDRGLVSAFNLRESSPSRWGAWSQEHEAAGCISLGV